MAGQTVILELPEAVYRWAERTARTTERAVESVLVDALKTTLPPPLDHVPAEWREELEALETLSTSTLLQVAREQLTAAQVRQYDRLLEKNRQGTLTSREHARLTQLRHAADRIMLRRARAYVLLKWRGYSVAEIIERAE
jgi:hypothetical protein